MQMLTGWGADLEFCLQENKTITTQLNEVRLQLEKMAYENKEFQINHDALRDQNADQAAELEDLRVCKLFLLRVGHCTEDFAVSENHPRAQDQQQGLVTRGQGEEEGGKGRGDDEELRYRTLTLDSF